MDSNLNNPHDKFVKEMFANREMAIEFLNTYLPDNLKEFLEIQSMEYSNTSSISPELNETFSDVILKIQVKGDMDK